MRFGHQSYNRHEIKIDKKENWLYIKQSMEKITELSSKTTNKVQSNKNNLITIIDHRLDSNQKSEYWDDFEKDQNCKRQNP